VKKVLAQSHRLYRRDRSCVHFKLFVDLANLYFPADMATFVLESLDGEAKSEGPSEEGMEGMETSAQPSQEGLTSSSSKGGNADSASCSHSGVIQRVVLPVLSGRECGEDGVGGEGEGEGEMIDHTITLLFACLPHLSQQSSTDIWDKVLQVGAALLCVGLVTL
jgi:hypothetical protein